MLTSLPALLLSLLHEHPNNLAGKSPLLLHMRQRGSQRTGELPPQHICLGGYFTVHEFMLQWFGPYLFPPDSSNELCLQLILLKTYLHCYLVHNRTSTQTYQKCNLCKSLSAVHWDWPFLLKKCDKKLTDVAQTIQQDRNQLWIFLLPQSSLTANASLGNPLLIEMKKHFFVIEE